MRDLTKLDKFTRDGFLSHDMQATIVAVRADFKDWFSLAEDVNRLGMRWLHEIIAPNVNSNKELLVGTLLLRGMQTFQAAILLAERAMVSDARSLARIISETAFAVGAAASDDAFIDRLVADHYLHRRKTGNALIGDPLTGPALTAEQRQLVEDALAEVRRRYGETGPQPIKWEQEAVRADMAGLYLMIYRGASGDSIHATALALDRHVGTSDKGEIDHLLFGPESKGLDDALSAAITSILHVLSVVPKLFPVPETELTPIVDRYKSLMA